MGGRLADPQGGQTDTEQFFLSVFTGPLRHADRALTPDVLSGLANAVGPIESWQKPTTSRSSRWASLGRPSRTRAVLLVRHYGKEHKRH